MFWQSKKNTKETSGEEIHCSFCGKSRMEVTKLIAGEGVHICDECVGLCNELIEQEDANSLASEGLGIPESLPTVDSLFAFLDEVVVGQSEAKRKVVGALRQHIHHLQHHDTTRSLTMLLVGPAGCGKTTLAQAMLQATSLPSHHTDCSRLSATGYIGEDVENALYSLYRSARHKREIAEKGIFVLDGLQRVASKGPQSITRDVTAEGVQRALIRVLEGQEVQLCDHLVRHPHASYIPFSCRHLLCVLICQLPEPPQHTEALQQRLVDLGILPELLDRIDLFVPMASLTFEELLALQQHPENGLLSRLEQDADMLGVKLHIAPELCEQWAQQATQSPSGAWYLTQKYASLRNILFVAPASQTEWQIMTEADIP